MEGSDIPSSCPDELLTLVYMHSTVGTWAGGFSPLWGKDLHPSVCTGLSVSTVLPDVECLVHQTVVIDSHFRKKQHSSSVVIQTTHSS